MIVTTWNIVPDYDAWGVDTSWTCDNWVQWHKELKKDLVVKKQTPFGTIHSHYKRMEQNHLIAEHLTRHFVRI